MQEEKKYYILDNVMSVKECLYLYHRLLSERSWSLSRSSTKPSNPNLTQFTSFPGMAVETNGEVYNEFFSGYFRSLVFRVKFLVQKEHNLILPTTIKRIHLGAKNSQSQTEFHTDAKNENAWTILGFLNPVWDNIDGGEFYLEDLKIDYKTARFVVFKSNLPHNGGFVTNDKLSNWRISLNVILLDKDS